MLLLVTAFAVSFLLTMWVVRSAPRWQRLVGDHDVSGPQKFHARPVPRIGSVGIVGGVIAGAALFGWREPVAVPWLAWFVVCALPALAAGFAEDLTKRQSPRRRLFFTAVSAVLAAWLVQALIVRTDIPGLDWVVGFSLGALLVTVFVVAGIANAVNIIDGFNGLASMCAMLILGSVAYVAYQAGDPTLGLLCLVGIGAVLGFFVWNFPAGVIFLGDGGAYFLGFFIAEVAILLLDRNPDVSPMFPLLVCMYPIFETIFSIYRKKFIRGMSPGVPDGVHFHMLVYRRLMRWAVGNREAKTLTRRNSMTSPYLWAVCMCSVMPAVIFWDNTPVLMGFILLFALGYVVLYWRIVRFKTPRWMIYRR